VRSMSHADLPHQGRTTVAVALHAVKMMVDELAQDAIEIDIMGICGEPPVRGRWRSPALRSSGSDRALFLNDLRKDR
jgi:hypothetical protein